MGWLTSRSWNRFAPWRVYNIGNNNPVELMISSMLLRGLWVKKQMEMLPLQPGDVPDTYADVDALAKEFDFKPDTPINEGVSNFVNWYRNYYDV